MVNTDLQLHKLKNVSSSAFYGYSNFAAVFGASIFLKACSRINEAAFSNVKGITTVIAGPNLNLIGSYAFYSCTSLHTVDLRETKSFVRLGNTTANIFSGTKLSSSTFNSTTGAKVLVPPMYKSFYMKSVLWSNTAKLGFNISTVSGNGYSTSFTNYWYSLSAYII